MYAFVAERRLQRWFTGEKHIKIIKRPQSKGCGFHIVRARPCSRKRTNKPPAMRVVEIALALCKKTPKFDIILKVRQPINISKGVSKWIIVVYHIHHGIVSII